MGLNFIQLNDLVIKPTLNYLGLGGQAAAELVLGTALQESKLQWLAQVRGPALGLWQMEPVTHDDIWKNFLPARPGLATKLHNLLGNWEPVAEQLVGNLYYACAMCRVFYLRVSEPLPEAGAIQAQAAYYKTHYNTAAGAATVQEFINSWTAAHSEN